MLYFIVLICLSIVSCHAETPLPQPVYCGGIPPAIFKCLGTPKITKPEASSQCDKILEECEKMTCLYTKSGWMKDNNLDKAKFSVHFDEFVKEHPNWQKAVEHMKTSCLTTDLLDQGIHTNCPAYDVTVCAFASFVKHAQPSQWSSSSDCEYPRQYAGACPVCPADCFAAAIPVGSCNACYVQPRTPEECYNFN